MITTANTILVTTTRPAHAVSDKRISNLIRAFSKSPIPIIITDYVTKNEPLHKISCDMITTAIRTFKNTTADYAIVCDNDFQPIDNFMKELNATVSVLPPTWRCLHLCPGYLWGRKFRDMTKIGHQNPEQSMAGFAYHPSGRVYINANPDIYYARQMWLGGPTAILFNKRTVDSFLAEFRHQYAQCALNNDVIFTKILTPNDFVCREPQLGHENEEGGTTFIKNLAQAASKSVYKPMIYPMRRF